MFCGKLLWGGITAAARGGDGGTGVSPPGELLFPRGKSNQKRA